MLPKKIVKAVERICASYLWNGVPNAAKGAKVQWKNVCLPKTEEGLGLKNLLDWNKAYLAMQIWLLHCESGSL